MAITAEAIKKLITILGFVPVDGEADVFHKRYAQHEGYAVRIDFANKIIEYIDTAFTKLERIIVGSKSTSNFSKDENFVVLECVDRLLEKGYAPRSIELEKVYPSGRGHSGELDILVNDTDGQAFLMIECKTWGKEYAKEVKKTLANGGQLFTYYKNATSSTSLCLYTSCLLNGKIEYENSIINVSEDWKPLSETKDIYERWNKILKKNGIFEDYASPYNIVHKKLTYGDLAVMKDEDSKKIFHQIMTILRHNGVSDKPNAFNKLLNLFVCKIIDEDRNADEELQFQCWEGLSDEKLQMTLNDLYKEGMLRFLEIRVIDHSESDVSKVLQELGIADTAHKQRLMEMFSDTRLKKSPNFAFIEVQDEKTFRQNAKIVREVVELLQQFKFRYEQRHEFLGDFFEKMLNTSMKQEAGQFFTPVPITRFIISSLPLQDFVERKIKEKDPDPLPIVIDYACGSGHFLTEFMSAMQTIIETVDVSKASPRTRNKLNSWRGDIKFDWANEYVYGIDFDNRLVKTAKVSAFFNGDGEATFIWGDGLDSFEHSEVYRGKLKETMPNKQDNGQFDILISNPPYSVEAFRRMLRHGEESFDLYSNLTDNSSEIECLFIERMKQLLKVGGWAGVILPSSILSNGGIYSRARDIIFKYFNVKAIVELGSGTFMETGTNTVVLFLERRSNSDHEKIMQAINTFFTNKHDVAVSGIEKAFSSYISNVYDDLSYEDYLSFVNENPSNTMKRHELYKDYVKEFGNAPYAKAFKVEKEKMLYFLLTHDQNIVIAKSGGKQDEKVFLGYERRKRRGHEGIKQLSGGTMLFDENNLSNPQKVNSHILNCFLKQSPMHVDESLSKYISYGNMSAFIEYGTSKFNRRVSLNKTPKLISKYQLHKIENLLINITGATTKIQQENLHSSGEIPVITQEEGTLISGYCDGYEQITDIPLIVMGDHTCVFKWVDFNFVRGADNTQLLKFNDDMVLPKYAYYLLCNIDVPNKEKYERHFKYVKEIKIPIAPFDIQQRIIDECEVVAKEIEKTKADIAKTQQSINEKFLEMFGDPIPNPMNWRTKPLGELGKLKNGMNFNHYETGYAIKCLGVGDFSNHFVIKDINSLSEINLSAEPSPDYLLQDGDIVFVRSNGNKALVGRSVEVFPEDNKVTFSGFCIRYRNEDKNILTIYLNHALHLPSIRNILLGRGANITNLNQQMLSSLKIPMPPLELQNDFSDFVNASEESKVKLQRQLEELTKKQSTIITKYL